MDFLVLMKTPIVTASIITPMTFSLIQPVATSLINAISGKGVMRAGKEKEPAFLLFLVLFLMMKVLGKAVRKSGRGYNNMSRMDNLFSAPSFK